MNRQLTRHGLIEHDQVVALVQEAGNPGDMALEGNPVGAVKLTLT